jgi:adenylate cyclase
MTATATPDLALEASPAPEQRWKAFQRDLPAGGCELEASILFADVRGSTALAERLSPTAFGELMCSFYRLAGDVVGRAGGVIEKVVGDGVVALFIPGITGPDHARRAIEAAHALLGAIERDADGSPRPPVGVAVHTGRVWLGQVPGPYGRRDVTALGDPVNVAAHLCAAAAAGELAISERAARAAGRVDAGQAAWRIRLKCRQAPVTARFYAIAPAPSGQSGFGAPAGDSKSLRYSPYPSASSLSTGTKRSAAELMQ